nr:YchJ family protein [Marinobacter salinus]
MSEPVAVKLSSCPCGSGQSYDTCCGRIHLGEPADSPEVLMRSRYSAFVLGLVDYLVATWHSSTRPETLSLENSPDWTSLRILGSAMSDHSGTVHFQAIYRAGKGWGYLEEHSDFVKVDGRWYYLKGNTSEGLLKPGRNEPCPCGSGKKHKACCL